MDLGDGVQRHPIQIYESLIMAVSFIAFILWRKHLPISYSRFAFYGFVLVYSAQRFLWEFLKPYPVLAWHLNVFHFVCLAMLLYAVYKIQRATLCADS